MRPLEFIYAMRSWYAFPVAAVGAHSRIEVSQQDELVAWGDTLHESVESLVEIVLCLIAAGKSGDVCTDDCDMSGRVE